jgi:hypothetical protein
LAAEALFTADRNVFPDRVRDGERGLVKFGDPVVRTLLKDPGLDLWPLAGVGGIFKEATVATRLFCEALKFQLANVIGTTFDRRHVDGHVEGCGQRGHILPLQLIL